MSIHHLVGYNQPVGRSGTAMSVYMCEKCRSQRLRHNREEAIFLDCPLCEPAPIEKTTLCGADMAAPGQDKTVMLVRPTQPTNRFLRDEIAAYFNVPVHMLGKKSEPAKRHHASKSTVISCNKLQPTEMIWLGRALDALTDLNLHIPSTLTLAELRETVKRIHTQAWQCLRIVQTRPLSKKVKKREKSRLFTIANKLRPLA